MTMEHVFKNKGFKDNDRILFNSAAAGFSMVTAAAIWESFDE